VEIEDEAFTARMCSSLAWPAPERTARRPRCGACNMALDHCLSSGCAAIRTVISASSTSEPRWD
jgi:hypothetical protein